MNKLDFLRVTTVDELSLTRMELDLRAIGDLRFRLKNDIERIRNVITTCKYMYEHDYLNYHDATVLLTRLDDTEKLLLKHLQDAIKTYDILYQKLHDYLMNNGTPND